jgi:hypothetical protein
MSHKQTIAEFSAINNTVLSKIQAKDPEIASKMNSHRVTPKDLTNKALLAKVLNRDLSDSKRFGGDTRARLRAKLQLSC